MTSVSVPKQLAPENLLYERLQLSPLVIRLLPPEGVEDTVSEFAVEIGWKKQVFRFAGFYSRQMTPKAFQSVLWDCMDKARQSSKLPLIVVPYLSDERLCLLEQNGISGLDLCGNGIVIVPEKLFVLRSGAPNRFTTSVPIKDIYQKTSSLVGRVLLVRPRYDGVGEVKQEIESRGGKISLATVSRILKALEEELIVGREGGEICLLQPDKLLAALTSAFERPAIRRTFTGKVALPWNEIPSALAEAAGRENVPLVATGEGTVGKYAVMAKDPVLSIYCGAIEPLLRQLPVKPDTLFPNLVLQETSDAAAYFDSRVDQGFHWASPLQTYLELMQGEKRDKETADQVKALLWRQMEGEVRL